MNLNKTRIEWKWGALAALAMTLIGLYPQINLWIARGTQWQGSYVLTQGDETAHPPYVNASMDDRPGRNDPFNRHDDRPDKPTSESLFSTQFLPAYAIDLPARLLGLSTDTAFIWLIVIGAITSSLAIFWLLATLTGDSKLAAVVVFFTLCLGALAAAQGVARLMITGNRVHDMFAFLRRYEPSAIFPLFFIFCLVVWRALVAETVRSRIAYSLFAGTLFAVLVFSYFFFWTASIAWLGTILFLWIVFRRKDLNRVLLTGSIIGIFAIASIIPFFILLSHRNRNMDAVHFLRLCHAPDLFYLPEIIGFIVLGIIGFAWRRKLIEIGTPLVLFAASCALMLVVVFNQQIITGRSLQPIHYKSFIGNYLRSEERRVGKECNAQ